VELMREEAGNCHNYQKKFIGLTIIVSVVQYMFRKSHELTRKFAEREGRPTRKKHTAEREIQGLYCIFKVYTIVLEVQIILFKPFMV
jgi:hypothetical protein